MVSCQKGPTRHAYAWQIGPFCQDTLDLYNHSYLSLRHVNSQSSNQCPRAEEPWWWDIGYPGSWKWWGVDVFVIQPWFTSTISARLDSLSAQIYFCLESALDSASRHIGKKVTAVTFFPIVPPWLSGGSRSPILASSSNLLSSPNLTSQIFTKICIWARMCWVLILHKGGIVR